eukprot:UN20494
MLCFPISSVILLVQKVVEVNSLRLHPIRFLWLEVCILFYIW